MPTTARQRQRPTRAQVLTSIRIAGYHGDQREWTRLYVENRISREAANEAFRAGARAREKGVPCSCAECARSNAKVTA